MAPFRKKITTTFMLMMLIFWIRQYQNMLSIFTHYRKSNNFIISLSSTRAAEEEVPTVAYIITVSGCNYRFSQTFFDAAAVVKRSVELASHPVHPTSRYGSKMYAILHPHAEKGACTDMLKQLGYEIEVRETPIRVENIRTTRSSVLRDGIGRNGCCGEKELLKLYAYDEGRGNPISVHLDLDVIVTKPLDGVFDIMMHSPSKSLGFQARNRLKHLVAPTFHSTIPFSEMVVNAFYTKDYNQSPPGKYNRVGMQGGFFIVRPNQTVFNELSNMVLEGYFEPGRDEKSGWYGSGYGLHIWGVMTIQGLLAYYYDLVANDTSVELNRCAFNQIADNPRRTSFHRTVPRGTAWNATLVGYVDEDCRDGRPSCDDVQCQTWPVEESWSLHYTTCGKPWNCPHVINMTMMDPTCGAMLKEWFLIRDSLQGKGPSQDYYPEVYFGHCSKPQGYNLLDRSLNLTKPFVKQ